MGFRLSGQLLETKTGLTPAQKLMLLGLAERADRLGRYAFPSVATLAQYAECSERTVELGLQALRVGGWITVQRKATNRLPTTYQLNLDRFDRGEETSPQTTSPLQPSPETVRGEETAPQENSRGELFGTLGANFSVSRGEETSPDPVSTEPIPEPIQGEESRSALPTPAGLVETWNAERQPGPKVTKLTPSLAALLRRALQTEPVLDDWRTAIRWLNRQAYANAPGGDGAHGSWRASLKWLAKPDKLREILDNAQTDATLAPRRLKPLGEVPGVRASTDRLQRRRAAEEYKAALEDRAAQLVLDLSMLARGFLERAVLLELDEWRERVSARAFDDLVLQALPKKLIELAHGRPLEEMVAELERRAVAA